MHFTLAVSAATAADCAVLVRTAQGADPRTMPIPGPAQVAWRSPDRRVPMVSWGSLDDFYLLTTPRPERRGFQPSPARVPVSQPTAPGRTRNV